MGDLEEDVLEVLAGQGEFGDLAAALGFLGHQPPEGLRLDTYANIIRGGERLAVLPRNPGLSELVRRIEGKARPRIHAEVPLTEWRRALEMMRGREVVGKVAIVM